MFDGSFEAFAKAPEYVVVNRQCAESWANYIHESRSDVSGVLDIATGVGTMANLFMRALVALGSKPALTCLDDSKWALELARQNVSSTEFSELTFVKDDIREGEINGQYDVIVWANGIHYLAPSEHENVLPKLRNALRPGGFFCFNTAFHSEAIPDWTRPFYSAKVKEASRILHKNGTERVRGLPKKPASSPQSANYYRQLVSEHGFRMAEVRDYQVLGGLYFYQAIASFHDYAEGALNGYPVPEAARALTAATGKAFAEFARSDSEGRRSTGQKYIERRWLSIISRAV